MRGLWDRKLAVCRTKVVRDAAKGHAVMGKLQRVAVNDDLHVVGRNRGVSTGLWPGVLPDGLLYPSFEDAHKDLIALTFRQVLLWNY